MRLRAVANGPKFDILLLRLFDEFPFNDDFLGVVTDTTGKLEVTDGDGTAEYRRVGGRIETRRGQLTVEQVGDADTPVLEEEKLEFWDYSRQTADDKGEKVETFLAVELDDRHTRFELWQGTALSPQRVFVS